MPSGSNGFEEEYLRRFAAFALLLTIFGAGCTPLPAAIAGGTSPSNCPDVTPHTSRFVTVAPNVRVEVLDWGGSGKAMVLLTGLGDVARVYDDFAFQWTDFFHVIAITRRGFGLSSKPSTGYDVASRAHDDVKVLDTLNVRRAVFVGHSIAGEELSRLGMAYANRVDKLVYLDAYDYADRFKLGTTSLLRLTSSPTSVPSTASMPLALDWKACDARSQRSAKHTKLTRQQST